MFDSRIAAEFAIADPQMLPSGVPPYWTDPVSGGAYYIEAVNEDEWAWYCWDPGHPDLGTPGQYQVPSWNLSPSVIPPGGTGTAIMSFQVTGSGMPRSDYRHSVIRASQGNNLDLLYNRHNSLKISHWLDTLLIDAGTIITAPPGQYEPEPPEYIYASDASVFFNSTPSNSIPHLIIEPGPSNAPPGSVVLSWNLEDAVNYQIQYADVLDSNTVWNLVSPGPGISSEVPFLMQWMDDGSVITNLPIQVQSNRFYRLMTP